MPVIKGNYTEKYTIIPNETLRDQYLSFEARGVLALMLSMPADWEMYKTWLVDQCPITGKDKMTRILKELENANYLVRVQKRNDGGKFDSYIWYVFPEPTENGLAADGSAGAGESAPTKERIKQSKENTNNAYFGLSPDLLSSISDHWNNSMHEFSPAINLTNKNKVNEKRWRKVKAIIKDFPEYSDHEYWEGHFSMLATLPELEWQRKNKQITFDQVTQLEKFDRNRGYMRMQG